MSLVMTFYLNEDILTSNKNINFITKLNFCFCFFLSIDSMTAYYLAKTRDIIVKEIDLSEQAQEKTSYENDAGVGRNQAVKICFGVDCAATTPM
jgi:hypothetical protein